MGKENRQLIGRFLSAPHQESKQHIWMGKERCEEVAPGSSVAIGKESGLRACLSHDGIPKKYGILRDVPPKNIKV